MTENDFQAAYNAGMNVAPVLDIEGVPHVVLPEGVKFVNCDYLLPNPVRKSARPEFDDANSFARYIEEHKRDTSRLFARPKTDGGEFLCVLDYHETGHGKASWCAHQASYICPHSEEWKLWAGQDGKWKPQREFAEFIESNAAHVVVPDAAAFLEMAQTLQTRTTVAFTSACRLDSGRDQIDYQSVSEAKAGEKGNLIVPSGFTLSLPVFVAGVRYDVKARLRHRITDARKLELRYELVNPALVVRGVWDDLVTMVGKATKLEVFLGRP